MLLITETTFDDIDYLVEDTSQGKKMYIEGIFIQTNKQNRNGRIYENSVIKPVIDKYVIEQINTGRALGTLEHENSPKVSLDKVSHRITEFRWDGDNVYGKALLLNTPNGNIAKGLIEGGSKLGVSSRGMGTLEKRKDGKTYVKDDFQLSTVDLVADPSAPEAFVNGILEGFEFIYDESGKLIQTRIEELEKQKTVQLKNESAQLKAFQKFLSRL